MYVFRTIYLSLQIFSILKTKYIDFTSFTFVIFIAKI